MLSWTTVSRGAFEHDAADAGIFALGVLAHHVEVDVADLAPGQRAGDAGHQAHRAEVHVLVELAAELEQRPPQRDVIGNLFRPADGAEEDGVVAPICCFQSSGIILPCLR
jgi:hypothetical protein